MLLPADLSTALAAEPAVHQQSHVSLFFPTFFGDPASQPIAVDGYTSRQLICDQTWIGECTAPYLSRDWGRKYRQYIVCEGGG